MGFINMRYRLLIIVIVLSKLFFSAFCEDIENELFRPIILATTTIDYPVTPGDKYQVTYFIGGEITANSIIVNEDSSVDLGLIGKLSARGMTFSRFRQEVKLLVDKAYPGSQPIVQIIGTGIFNVLITGEVIATSLTEAWGLTRLSQVIEGKTTDLSSLRNVEIVREDGSSRTFDLFMAERTGDMESDPLVRPGDKIIVHRIHRRVTLSGEIERPGSYQLLDGDTLKDLVECYGRGFTPLANPNEVRISRRNSLNSEVGETYYLRYEEALNQEFADLDEIHIGSRERLRPFIFVDGALSLNSEDSTSLEASTSRAIQILPNTRLSTLLESIGNGFTQESDLENAYIRRGNATIKVNLREILYKENLENDITLEGGDRLVIPFHQLFITVGGAVFAPGRYPYIPDRLWGYYAQLAGGIDELKSTGTKVSIKNFSGDEKNKAEFISPEDRIYVDADKFLYNLNRVTQAVTPLVTLTISIVTLVSLLTQ